MAQVLRPDATIASTGWTASAGTHHSCLDEATASDTDYVECGSGTDVLRLGVQNPAATPGAGTVTFHYRGLENGLGATHTITPTARVNGTVIATGATQNLPGTATDYSFTFDAALVTDWTALELCFQRAGGTVRVTQTYYEVPDGVTTTPVSRALSSSYDIKAAVARTLAASYNVHATVARQLGASYDIRAFVSRELQASYDIKATVSRQLAASYDVLAGVSRALAASYDIQGLTAVSRELDAGYAVRAFVEATRSASYDISAGVARDLSVTYDVLEGVAAVKAFSYNVQAQVARTLQSSYDMPSAVFNGKTFRYNIGDVGEDAATWHWSTGSAIRRRGRGRGVSNPDVDR